ncbi:anti-sigma factor domain-containing protein [Fictibacillus fluitans]|uniref:Anti-sigma factor domain-containing protein n=1 Tax=Fictibacillus fluitans TaxID=3058422 RepID=A0ABT8HXR0_9BACL|nr:anti-sigma factor domain-containing protein [Fictibacillus sp. NE201]MDN4525565.1 anti-sigma factor domain-containing protein [Fictibacillus sp. NE201]
MKNGILMEVKKGKAILLTKDGSFISVKLPKGKKLVPGMEYDVSSLYRSRTRRFFLPTLSVTIGALLIFVLFSGVNPLSRNDETVAAYVSFDVNPSLEAAVNENLQVIHVKAFNTEGENLVNSLQYAKDISLFQFASSVFNAYDQQGYLSKNPDVLIASTVVDQSNKKVSASIQEAVTAIKRNASFYNKKAAIVIKKLDVKKRNAAKKNGVSPGKYLLYLDAKQKHNPLSLKDVKKMSFSDLKKKVEKKNDQQQEKRKEKIEVPEKVLRNDRDLQPEKIHVEKVDKQPSQKPVTEEQSLKKQGKKKANTLQNNNKKVNVKSAEPVKHKQQKPAKQKQDNLKVTAQSKPVKVHPVGPDKDQHHKKLKTPPGHSHPNESKKEPSSQAPPKSQKKMKVKTVPVHENKNKMNKGKSDLQKQRNHHEKKRDRGHAPPPPKNKKKPPGPPPHAKKKVS